MQELNRDDAASLAMRLPGRQAITFGIGAPQASGDFGVRDGWLVEGGERMVAASALVIHGTHNLANALAACALARAFGVPRERMAAALTSFRGLPHRLAPGRHSKAVHRYHD